MAHISDYSKGPLDRYRKKASFNWKKLKVFLYSEEGIDFQVRVYGELEKYPILFQRFSPTPLTDEIKRISAMRSLILQDITKLFYNEIKSNQYLGTIWSTIIFEMESSGIQYGISFEMFSEALSGLGTQQHFDVCKKNLAGEIIAGFCLTEVGHGSNTKSMQTVARYDKATKEFVLNTPNFLAAKCWMGNIGKIATHAVVYAQLVTPDQINHGLHAFLVNIRSPETLLPYSGITIGDIGEKIGLEGLDNGFIIFNEYRIPKGCLLNKLADITDDGKYIRNISDPAKQFGISLGPLVHGRLKVVGIGVTHLLSVITITVRCAAIKKKIGPIDEQGLPSIEYPIYQQRLLPYLAIGYIGKIIFPHLILMHSRLHHPKNDQNNFINMGMELHAISSAAKPVIGWIIRDGMKECLETCADHGYLKASDLDNLRSSCDPNNTAEGENHVLIQQASNWLLKLWPLVLNQKEISFPLSSVNFLNKALDTLNSKFNIKTIADFINPSNILGYYQWLVCYLLKKTYEKYERLLKTDKLNPFWTKNESQVYYCKSLAIAYIQTFIVQSIQSTILKASDDAVKTVLTKILSLYGIWNLQEHVASFYEGGYTDSPKFTQFIEESIILLCDDLKDDAIALVDVIAPPDFVIKAALGQSDGQVYEHLEAELMQTQNTYSRPSWWIEISQRMKMCKL